jgi:RNA polymerase sigma-70 factor (ECF subfamily)
VDRYPFDAEYLRRLRDGDPSTVDHFVGYFTEKLTIKLWRSGLSKSEKDDAVQETFARVLVKLSSPDGIVSPERFGAFVFGVCKNYLFEQRRMGSRIDQLGDDCFELPAPDPDVEQMLLRGEQVAKVLRTLKLMKPKEAEILRTLFIEGLSKDEVCQRFGITRTYLRVVLHRAIARFRFLFPKG